MSTSPETLILTARDVERLLAPAACREAVAAALTRHGAGGAPDPQMLASDAGHGTFHVKAVLHPGEPGYFAAKLNGNFPSNPGERGLPTIQGVLLLSSAVDGRLLCVIDSGSLTAVRTAAATAVAIEHLARKGASVAALIGCGRQGESHLHALEAMGRFRELRLFDVDGRRARRLAGLGASGDPLTRRVAASVAEAVNGADVIVTCTSGNGDVLTSGDVAAGALVAAVGADNPRKRELNPALLGGSAVVVDDLAQCLKAGELHHAVDAGLLTAGDVRAELGQVLAGRARGRVSDQEIVIFDSTGTAIQDAAAAELLYLRAIEFGLGLRVRLAE